MITFVSYFVNFSEETLDNITKAFEIFFETRFAPLKSPSVYLSVMYNSAKKFHPSARFVFMTDEDTDLTLPDFVEIIRVSESDERVTSARFNHIMDEPSLCSPDSHIIILDPDIVIRENLESIFSQPADIFLTYQKDSTKDNVIPPKRKMIFPINLGFVAFKKENKKQSFEMFRNIMTASLKVKQKHFSYWFGLQGIFFQLFKTKLLECEKSGIQQPYIIKFGDITFSFLDAEIYNFTPSKYLHIPLDTRVLHFKGPKKKLMLQYWEQIKDESL